MPWLKAVMDDNQQQLQAYSLVESCDGRQSTAAAGVFLG
jgi:hypothetical protein